MAASIFSIAWSMVKLAAVWRGRQFLNVAGKGVTIACAPADDGLRTIEKEESRPRSRVQRSSAAFR